MTTVKIEATYLVRKSSFKASMPIAACLFPPFEVTIPAHDSDQLPKSLCLFLILSKKGQIVFNY